MWRIVLYTDPRGKCPPLEFIDALPATEQAKIRNALRLLREFGPDLRMPHARQVKGRLWELRPGASRLFYCAYVEQQFVVLHAFRKQSRKTPEKEIQTALRRLEELLKEV